MAVFAVRLSRERTKVSQVEIMGKFAGAVGSYNAHLSAYPNISRPDVAEEFVKSVGLNFNAYVTQITRAGEIGSSAMPHKVNPIDFENSEGNLGKANAGLSFLGMKLPISWWQRDLTHSTVLRNMGEGLGHSLLAYKSALQGIAKLQVNEARLSEDLDQSWEVLAEPIQTVMQRFGVPEPYEKLKELTRGRAVSEESMREFIDGLVLTDEVKTRPLKLIPHSYTGAAAELASNVDIAITSGNRMKVL